MKGFLKNETNLKQNHLVSQVLVFLMMNGWILGKEQLLPNDTQFPHAAQGAALHHLHLIRHARHGHALIQDQSPALRHARPRARGHVQFHKHLPGLGHGHAPARVQNPAPDLVQCLQRVIIQALQAATVPPKRGRLQQEKGGKTKVQSNHHMSHLNRNPNRNPNPTNQDPNHLHLLPEALLNQKPLQTKDHEPHLLNHRLVAMLRTGDIGLSMAEETEKKDCRKRRRVKGLRLIVEWKVADQWKIPTGTLPDTIH